MSDEGTGEVRDDCRVRSFSVLNVPASLAPALALL